MEPLTDELLKILKRFKFRSKIKTLKEVNLNFEIFYQNIFKSFENKPEQISNSIKSIITTIGPIQGYEVIRLANSQNETINTIYD